MSIVKVHVNDIDIRSGNRGDCWSCPVAQALSRALDSTVMVQFTNAFELGFDTTFDLPTEVQRRIAQFDEQGVMAPFGFEVSVQKQVSEWTGTRRH